MIKLKNSSLGIKQQSLTQKVTCSPMIKLKNSSLGIKQQSLTHSLAQKVTCSLMPSVLFFTFIMGEQVIF
jgi:hypothetical protein